jgi:hypothetical protein
MRAMLLLVLPADSPGLLVLAASNCNRPRCPATTAASFQPPTAPRLSPTASPAGTPWPAPTNLRVTTEARLLDEDGRPLPPELQEYTDVLTWDHLSGFHGEYEVEVTLVPIGGGAPTVLPGYMRFPADRGAGTIRRASQYPEWLNNQRCYRIRTTIPSGAGTIETGPFSASTCTVKPPSDGGAGPTPGAPRRRDRDADGRRAWALALGAVLGRWRGGRSGGRAFWATPDSDGVNPAGAAQRHRAGVPRPRWAAATAVDGWGAFSRAGTLTLGRDRSGRAPATTRPPHRGSS